MSVTDNTLASGTTCLGKRHIRDDDDVEGRGRILLDARIATRVVLVRAGAAVLLPGLTVGGFGNGPLGGRAGWGAR
jgi:hypothetical protein